MLWSFRVLRPRRFTSVVLCGLSLFVRLQAQDFKIEEFRVQDATVEVTVPASDESYYILQGGESVTALIQPAAMILGGDGLGVLRAARAPNSGTRFYRVQRVPVAAPFDSDQDGIDDVWELRFRKPGAALNGNDALEDQNGNGLPDLSDVQAVIASFVTPGSVVLAKATLAAVPLSFSRAFAGTLRYTVGGTAVPGVDFAPLAGELAVSGTSASLPITILPTSFIEPERRLVLTLSQAAANPPPYLLGATQVHELRIIEGDRGVYFGSLAVTNGFVLGAQPVRVAIRSDGAAGRAFFDTSQGSFFTAPFELPVRFDAQGWPVEFTDDAGGSILSSSLGREVGWKLQFATLLAGANSALTAKFTLELSGLTASGQKFTAVGLLQLNRADN